MLEKTNPKYIGYITICAILWGLAGPMIRWSSLPMYQIIVIRLSIPFLLSWIWLKFFEKVALGKLTKSMLFSSVMAALGNSFYMAAFYFTTISHVLLLLYTRPLITTFFAAFILKEKIEHRNWLLLAISATGVYLIANPGGLESTDNDKIGMIFAIGAAISSSLSWIYIKKTEVNKRSTVEIILYQHLIGAVMVAPFIPWALTNNITTNSIFWAGSYAVVVGLFANILYFNCLKKTKISTLMPITYLELLVALFVGVTIFSEELTWNNIIGGILILSASGSATMIGRKTKPAPSS